MAKPKLTKEQKDQVVKEYLEGISAAQISRNFQVSSQSIDSLLKRRGVPKRRRRRVDEAYFESIDSEEKAYWLGFLFAEGSLDTKRYCLSLKLGKDEKEQVEKFQAAIKSEHPISQTSDGREAWVIKIGSQRICNSLLAFGFGKGKTLNIRLPNIPENLKRHFIRGYFDGDGWFSHTEKPSAILGFCSCSEKILVDVQKWLNEQLSIESGCIVVRKRNHIPNQHDSFRLQYGGRNLVKLIGNLLYKDASVFIHRKKDRFDLLKATKI